MRKNQCVDKNGNNVPADNVNNKFYDSPTESNDSVKFSKQVEQKAITRLQAMSMSDDEDFGKKQIEKFVTNKFPRSHCFAFRAPLNRVLLNNKSSIHFDFPSLFASLDRNQFFIHLLSFIGDLQKLRFKAESKLKILPFSRLIRLWAVTGKFSARLRKLFGKLAASNELWVWKKRQLE